MNWLVNKDLQKDTKLPYKIAEYLHISLQELDILINTIKNIQINQNVFKYKGNEKKIIEKSLNVSNQEKIFKIDENEIKYIERILKLYLSNDEYSLFNERIITKNFHLNFVIETIQLIYDQRDSTIDDFIESFRSELPKDSNLMKTIREIKENVNKSISLFDLLLYRRKLVTDNRHIFVHYIILWIIIVEILLKHNENIDISQIKNIRNKFGIEERSQQFFKEYNTSYDEIETLITTCYYKGNCIEKVIKLYNSGFIKWSLCVDYIENYLNGTRINAKLCRQGNPYNIGDTIFKKISSVDTDSENIASSIKRFVNKILNIVDSGYHWEYTNFIKYFITPAFSIYANILKINSKHDILKYALLYSFDYDKYYQNDEYVLFTLISNRLENVELYTVNEKNVKLIKDDRLMKYVDIINKRAIDSYKEITTKLTPLDCLKNDTSLNILYESINNYKANLVKRIEELATNDMKKISTLIDNQESFKNILISIYKKDNKVSEYYFTENDDNELMKSIADYVKKNEVSNAINQLTESDDIDDILNILTSHNEVDVPGASDFDSSTKSNILKLISSCFNSLFILNAYCTYSIVKLFELNPDNSQISSFIEIFYYTTIQFTSTESIDTILSLRYTKNILERNKLQDFTIDSVSKNSEIDLTKETILENVYEKYIKIKNNDDFIKEYIRYVKEIFNHKTQVNKISIGSNIININENSITIKNFNEFSNNPLNDIDNEYANRILYNRMTTSLIYDDNISFDPKQVIYSLIDNNIKYLNEYAFFNNKPQYKNSYDNICEKFRPITNGLNNLYKYDKNFFKDVYNCLNKYSLFDSLSKDIKNDSTLIDSTLDIDSSFDTVNVRRIYEFILLVDIFHKILRKPKKIVIINVLFDILCCYNFVFNDKPYYSLIHNDIFNNNIKTIRKCLKELYTDIQKDRKLLRKYEHYRSKSSRLNLFDVILRLYNEKSTDIDSLIESHSLYDQYIIKKFNKYISYKYVRKTLIIDEKIIEILNNYQVFRTHKCQEILNETDKYGESKYDDICEFDQFMITKTINKIILNIISGKIFEIKLKKYLTHDCNKLFVEIVQKNYNSNDINIDTITISYEYLNLTKHLIGRTLDPNMNFFTIVHDFINCFIYYSSDYDIDNENNKYYQNVNKKLFNDDIYYQYTKDLTDNDLKDNGKKDIENEVNMDYNTVKYDKIQYKYDADDVIFHSLKHMNAGNIKKPSLIKILVSILMFLFIVLIVMIVVYLMKNKPKENELKNNSNI